MQVQDISFLRSRISQLVTREGELVAQAAELSRSVKDDCLVDALFGQIAELQAERLRLKAQIAHWLGAQRMHVAAEVWRPGLYEYRREVGHPPTYVLVQAGLNGLEVWLPHRKTAVAIETMSGSFEGPISSDSSGPPDSP